MPLSGYRPFRGAMVRKTVDLTNTDFTAGLTLLAFQTTVYDLGGWFTVGVSQSKLVVPVGVSYIQVGATVCMGNAVFGTEVQALVQKNGSVAYDGIPWQAMEAPSATIAAGRINLSSGPLPVVGGDYFELTLQVGSDTTIDIAAAQTTFWAAAVA